MIRALHNLGIGRTALPVTGEWLAELSTDRYRPMLRLLQEDDWRFLRDQHGFQPEIEKSLRRQRVQIFQGYLRMLRADFRRLCGGLSEQGARGVVQRRAEFAVRVMAVRARLALYRKGLGCVDASGLVGAFEDALGAIASAAPEMVRAAA
jgi:hypothetical protein